MSSFGTKEALKNHIHSIHDKLRNSGGGYGMAALNVVNVIYGLKLVEPLIRERKIKLSDTCLFSELCKIDDDEKLRNKLARDVLDELHRNHRDFLFYEIPRNISCSLIRQLFNDIEKISSEDQFHLAGKMYEYFIGRDESAIKELGAYFTERQIVNYIIRSKLKPTIEDGKIKTMIDPFGGSGGFTLMYADYHVKTFGQDIDWKKEINKIYHFDLNNDVIKSAALEMFALTKECPNMISNFKRGNTFQMDFDDCKIKKFHYVITNPPYGGDKTKKTVMQKNCERIIDFIKKKLTGLDEEDKEDSKLISSLREQKSELEGELHKIKEEEKRMKVSIKTCGNQIKDYCYVDRTKNDEKKFNCNDKESASLVLIMSILEEGGTAVGVLKEGVFFDSKYADLRKHLIENFNIKWITSVPSDAFENTATKTSIVCFENSKEKTSNVEFFDLEPIIVEEDVFEIDSHGKAVMVKSQGTIEDVRESKPKVVSLEEIIAMKYTLNAKDYKKEKLICNEGFELVKLGDVCAVNPKSKIDKDKPTHKYVEISDIDGQMINGFSEYKTSKLPANAKNTAEYYDIMISTVRPKKSKCILVTNHIENLDEYIFSGALAIVRANDKMMARYAFGALMLIVQDFEKKLCNGSGYPRFQPKKLNDIEIPMPTDKAVLKSWSKRIGKPYEEKISKTRQLKDLEEEIKKEIKRIGNDEDCETYKLGDICEFQNGYAFKTDSYKKTGVPIVSIKHIPFFNIENNCNYFEDIDSLSKFKVKKNDILISLTGKIGNACNIGVYDKNYDSFLNQRVAKIIPRKYRHFVLYSMDAYILDEANRLSKGSVQGNISTRTIENCSIQIPKDKSLIKSLDDKFALVDKLNNDIKKAEEEYNRELNELKKTAIKEPEELQPHETPDESSDDIDGPAPPIQPKENPKKNPKGKSKGKTKEAK